MEAKGHSEREYWTFISYRHLDDRQEGRQWATWLHQQLETYRIPDDLVGTLNSRGETIPSRLFPCFRDEDELSAGGNLTAKIYDALDRSRTLLVICSPNTISSRYVDQEIEYFQKKSKGDDIFLALIDGDSKARAGEPRHCIPELLCKRNPEAEGFDPATDPTSLAADFRLEDGTLAWTSPEAYRRERLSRGDLSKEQRQELIRKFERRQNLARLKLLSGILGVPLGTLQKRDEAYQLAQAKRRARTLRRWLGAVTILFLAAVSAATLAWIAKKEANHHQGEAEELVAFLLGDLHDRLEPIGQLRALEAVVDRSSLYLEMNPAVRSAENRVRLHARRGQIQKQLGKTEDSIREFRKALGFIEGISDPARSLISAEIHAELGDALTYAALFDEATKECEFAIEILNEIGEILPGDQTALILLAKANIYLADVHIREGEAVHALTLYDKAVNHLDKVDPSVLGLQVAVLLDAILKLGDARLQIDDTDGSLRDYRNCRDRAHRYGKEAQADIRYLRWQAEAALRIARVLSLRGDLPQATEETAAASTLLGRLVAHDPANLTWQARNYAGLIEMARLEGDLGRPESAARQMDGVLAGLRTLASTDSANVEFQHLLCIGLNFDGELHYSPRFSEIRDLDRAETALKNSVRICGRILENTDGGRDALVYRKEHVTGHLHLARIQMLKGNFQEAVDNLRGLLALLDGLRSRSGNGMLLSERASIHGTLGEIHRRNGEPDLALAAFRSAVDYRRGNTSQAPGNLDYKLDLATELLQFGVALLQTGRDGSIDDALATLEDCARIAGPLLDAPSEHLRGIYLIAKCATELAVIYHGRGLTKEQSQNQDMAARALQKLEAAGYRNDDCKNLRARLDVL